MANMATADSRVSPVSMIPKLVLATIALIILFTATVYAQTWYLMAADEKTISEPRVAIRMEHGPTVGPLEFTSRGKFAERAECEPARQKIVSEWRRHSVIKRGSWDRYGFTSPSVFTRCVPANDPMLKRAGADAPPTMETFVNRPRR
jgi:hypothetical protein